MPFTISGTELVMTSSPSYASELAGIANVNVIGADNSVIDTSYYTAVKLNGTLIVDRNLIINVLKFTNTANDNLLLGIDDTDALGRAVNLVVLSNTTEAFQRGAFGVKIRNSSINAMNGGRLGYYDAGPLWDLDNATITSKETYDSGGFGVAGGSILENSTIIDSESITFFGSPASSSNFEIKGRTQWGAFIDRYFSEVLLSKFSSPRYTVQRAGKFVLTDCKITDWIAFRLKNINVTAGYFTFRRTMATNAVGPNANAQTTRYVYSSAGDLLANTALNSSGSASEIVQWGKVDADSLGENTNSETLDNKMTPEMINTNTGTYTHIAGEYKLPLTVAHVSYLGAIDINTGITFDVSAEEYLSDYTLSPNLVNDSSITETTKATVDAYTTLETPQKFYDYAKSYLVDNYSGETSTLVARSNAEIDAGSYNVTIDSAAASTFAFDGSTITIKASEFTGDMTTNGVITLANDAEFFGTRTDSNGTILPVKTVSITGLVSGSRLRIYNNTKATEVYNAVVNDTSYTAFYQEDSDYSEGDTINIRVTYVNGVTAKLGYTVNVTAGSSGWNALIEQEDDSIYNSFEVDGSTIAQFTADYANDQVDVVVGTNFYLSNFYAWWVYNLYTEDGIRDFFGGIIASDQANFEIKTNVLSLYLDNSTNTNIRQLDNRRFFRTDAAYPVLEPTTGGGGIDVVWRNQILIAETDTSGLTPSESALLNEISSLATSTQVNSTQVAIQSDIEALETDLRVVNENVQKASLLIPATEDI
jgi:hypothetical protein